MSRIGNKTITIPAGVDFIINEGNEVTVKGPKGSLTRRFSELLEIKNEAGVVTVVRPNDEKHVKQLHGTTRALLNNMVVGVSEGFKKDLDIVGIGFRAALNGGKLVLSVGYSHPVVFEIPSSLEVKVENKDTHISIAGIDKQVVGEFAANVRATRKPEPYKGKGIKYTNEHIRRKEGKTAGKK